MWRWHNRAHERRRARVAAAWLRCVGDTHDGWALFDSLLGRHREPHRHYHGVRHVTWVVRHVEELAVTEPVDDIGAVVVAAFFHDAVYDPQASDNESASARLADRELAALGWDDAAARRVTTMVEATATHDVPDDPESTSTPQSCSTPTWPCSAANRRAYQAYVAGVRSEYAHVSADDWHTGRTQVLQSFLDRPALYATATARARWEPGHGPTLRLRWHRSAGAPTVERMPADTSLRNAGPDHTGPTIELLQALIRNECVNDGTPDSGEEVRNADLLQTYLGGAGLDVAALRVAPGRASIVARIEGSDPDAPTLCLMGHTDVVPVNPDGWSRDPFGGELIDGEVWGRGAIDMLNITVVDGRRVPPAGDRAASSRRAR